MKTSRIYVDTSVIGGCLDSEFMQWSNGLLRDFQNGLLKCVVSDIVSIEIDPAPLEVKIKYAEFLSTEAEVLVVSAEALALLQAYKKHSILPAKFQNDMLHIALATVAGVDVLASWNFKHIVRYDKIRVFNAVNMENGYGTISIFSPREVTTYEEN
jgi:predicted nucleic acid-binding protein